MALLSSQPVYLPNALPSPTLTNPDLILPYRSSSLSASSVTQRLPEQYSTRPRTEGHRAVANHEDSNIKESMQRLLGNGVRLDRSGSEPAMPFMESRSRNWRVGDYDFRRKSKERLFLTPSPTPDDQYDLESLSDSIYPEINNGHWEGFDGPAEEVLGHTYQSESQKSPYAKPTQRNQSLAPLNGSQEIRAILDEDEDDPQSHAAMSRRAENILANAKKRLLTMENNLSRARHGLGGRPSSSMSSFAVHSRETAPPYTAQERRYQNNPVAASPWHSNSVLASGSAKGHTRVFSETSVPSLLHSQVGLGRPEENDEEGLSVFKPNSGGATQASPARAQITDATRTWVRTGFNRNGNTPGRLHKALEPLHEDKPAPASFDSSPFASSSPSLVNPDIPAPEHHLSDATSLTLGNSQATGLTRARSTYQMRDLRDQMQDLKGKISSLKQKAREDSMRRRSLQSLRTPSPFTAAEQWYTANHDHLSACHKEVAAAPEMNGWTGIEGLEERNQSPPEVDQSGIIGWASDEPHGISHPEGEEQRNETRKEHDIVVDPYHDSSDSSSTCDSAACGELELTKTNIHRFKEPDTSSTYYEPVDPVDIHLNDDHEAEDEDDRPDAPIEQMFHDSSTLPIGERHEDRPDAFDYEHFFLHSGMGHHSTADISRTSSHSSMYSMETTKPSNHLTEEPSEINEDGYSTEPNVARAGSNARPNIHLRQNSGESISTVATFATATEGGDPDGEVDDGWVIRRPMAGSWQPESPSREKPDRDGRRFDRLKASRRIRLATSIKELPSQTHAARSSSPTTPTQASSGASSSHPSSLGLLSTLSASTPTQEGVSATSLHLRDGDKDLVERLIRSLFNVCVHLHADSAKGEIYESKVWRRKLDAARRVLDGDFNSETF